MASDFTSDDLARVAALARVALTGDEPQLFARQLAAFLETTRAVREIDAADVPPTSHPLGASAPLRDDDVRASLSRDAALGAAPDADLRAGLFKVPRVIG